jgi:Fur family ferric uptake transcriptional regulator
MTLRTTRQRTAIFDALNEADEFRSAQQWHESMSSNGDRIGLATVYRNLQAMADAGAVDAVRDDDGEVLYRLCHSTGEHHHHLRCRSCGAAVEIDGPAVETWAEAIAEKHGYTGIDHTIELSGICRECAAAGTE